MDASIMDGENMKAGAVPEWPPSKIHIRCPGGDGEVKHVMLIDGAQRNLQKNRAWRSWILPTSTRNSVGMNFRRSVRQNPGINPIGKESWNGRRGCPRHSRPTWQPQPQTGAWPIKWRKDRGFSGHRRRELRRTTTPARSPAPDMGIFYPERGGLWCFRPDGYKARATGSRRGCRQ